MSSSQSPRERIEQDLKAAMKARDTVHVQTLRLLLAAIKNRGIEKTGEVDEKDFVAIVRREIKQSEETAQANRDAGRPQRAAEEEAKIERLQGYLPPTVDEEVLRAQIGELIAERELSGPQAMGTVMKEMMTRHGAAADGKVISAIARDLLK
ncbi:MAG TPA: GatB/YqeY domain-containing protein [Thermoanaerobaculia bacterium]|nr:GatB/YqeY domain-containing protein [Thermoanaerobaculia bacterium]